MQKVYLLLRNNRQSGPYTLDELLQQDLKPFDLVWVEGRSAAWRYPGEIDALKPYVPEPPRPDDIHEPIDTALMESAMQLSSKPRITQPASKKVFVSMPWKSAQRKPVISESVVETQQIEPKAEKKTSFQPEKSLNDQILSTNYSRSLHEVEEDYTNWVYQQKQTRKKTRLDRKDLGVLVLLLAVIVLGYFLLSRPSVISESNQLTTAQSRPPATIIQQNESDEPGKSNTEESHIPVNVSHEKPVIHTTTPKLQKTPAVVESNPKSEEYLPPVSDPVQQATSEGSLPQQETPVVAEQPQEKKKKFGAKLKGLFSKKDKKQNEAEENPPAANGRQAAKRHNENSEEALPTSAELASQIDLSSEASDNWMMGINGVKLTLRNRNNLPIRSAQVSVLYYDQNNRLLETKSIQFSNIPARGKATQPVPDHKFAAHVEFKLGTVSAEEDRMAGGRL